MYPKKKKKISSLTHLLTKLWPTLEHGLGHHCLMQGEWNLWELFFKVLNIFCFPLYLFRPRLQLRLLVYSETFFGESESRWFLRVVFAYWKMKVSLDLEKSNVETPTLLTKTLRNIHSKKYTIWVKSVNGVFLRGKDIWDTRQGKINPHY